MRDSEFALREQFRDVGKFGHTNPDTLCNLQVARRVFAWVPDDIDLDIA